MKRQCHVPCGLVPAVLALILLGTATEGLALDKFFVGPRALAMAGSNVASVRDTTAQYYNPAAFGFFARKEADGTKTPADASGLGDKKWGVDLGAGLGFRLHNEFGTFLDDLAEIDPDALSNGSVQSASDLADLINLANDLNGLEKKGNAISADLNAGLGVRVLHGAVGVRLFAQASGRVLEVDTTNLGLSGSVDLSQEINAIDVPGNDGDTKLFTPEQIDALKAATLDDAAIQKLDFVARQEGLSTDAIALLTDIVEQTGPAVTGGDLEDNTTTVLLTGFGLVEVPLTYGYAINDHIAVGANLKLMKGRVYGTQVVVFNKDSGDVISDVTDNYKESTNVGLDLAAMARYAQFQFGLVVRNINAPKFDGPTINEGTPQEKTFADVTVDPQATVGAAYCPFPTLVVEADLDLLSNETTLNGYDTQNISLGAEWDAFRVLALRAGLYKNLAEDDIGVVYTVGLGLNLWAVRLDLAGAFAAESEQYNGDDIPKETRVAAQLSVDF